MKTLGQEIQEKYNLRKETIVNMGIEDQEAVNPENFSCELEKCIYNYNVSLENANENMIQKGQVITTNSRFKRLIKKVARKLLFALYGNLMEAVNYFQDKVIHVLVANRDIFLYQEDIIGKLQENSKDSDRKMDDLNGKVHEFMDGIKGSDRKINELADKIYELADETRVSDKKMNELTCRIHELENRNNELTHKVDEISVLKKAEDDTAGAEDDCEILLKKFQNEEENKEEKLSFAYCHRMEQLLRARDVVLIFCVGLQKYGNLEAIRNEAYDTFIRLKRNQNFNVILVSLEKRNVMVDENIIYTTHEWLEATINRIHPKVILIFESLPLIALDFNGVFYRYRTIIKITSQNPLQDLAAHQIDELRHANDFGVFRFLVESAYAKQIMMEHGFFHVKVMQPVIDYHRVCFNKKLKAKMKFTVGLASSPVQHEQMEDKGIGLLENLVLTLAHVRFRILWRNNELEAPSKLRNADNCDVIYGQADMRAFYREIDILIVPYTSESNHACSLSGVEAILSRVPVLCTEQSGVAEIVHRYCAGIVCKADAENMASSISEIMDHYVDYCERIQIAQVRNDFAANQLEDVILDMMSAYFPNEFITIQHWDEILSKEGKHLVRGHLSMKKYYQNQKIAADYNHTRFIQYPGNCYDIMERGSVNVIMSQMFQNRSDSISILDIACGDGRIIQENIKWGMCTAVDASASMLEMVKKRFQGEKNLVTRQCDFFEDEIRKKFDVVTAFRYIRHYDGAQRMKLYKKIRSCLHENGVLLFDVCSMKYSMEDRRKAGWGGFHIYDVFWTESSIKAELQECGFRIAYLLPVEIQALGQGPVTWTVAAIAGFKEDRA